jgi:predicted TIM-barrel fold metal-dependent hydrolase
MASRRTLLPSRLCRNWMTLAKYPNVAAKASEAPGYSSEPYRYRNIYPCIPQIYDAFGPRRIFW